MGILNLSHKLDKDLITEGDETLELKLFTDAERTEQVGDTKEITIEDVIPTYAINTININSRRWHFKNQY